MAHTPMFSPCDDEEDDIRAELRTLLADSQAKEEAGLLAELRALEAVSRAKEARLAYLRALIANLRDEEEA